jgi:hypothetical protein
MLKKGKCMRNAINFTKLEKYHKIDKGLFDETKFNLDLDIRSPKMVKLLDKIRELDENDLKTDGHLYKHIIYSDVKTSSAGIKVIAGALTANNYKNIYDSKFKIDDGLFRRNTNNNYALLTSLSIYNKPFPVKLKKKILELFNERPDNIYGENIRFLLLDQGYKEGIDVFDVKYLHIFDDLLTSSDQKQVVGRGTRFCGQKGLEFIPNEGWKLQVFKYNLLIPENLQEFYGTDNSFEIVMKESGLDINKLIFASELERASIKGSVDNTLNKIIKAEIVLGGGIKGKRKRLENKGYILHKNPIKIDRKLSYDEMQKYVERYYRKYKLDEIKFENGCIEDITDNSRIVKFTKTQDFVSKFFNHQLPYKGMLYWHSVGTGKTCSAIATATRGFEEAGYTILWVTRHTLKEIIWKNMFDKICSVVLQDRYNNGEKIPTSKDNNSKSFLSDSWKILPMSYKQFSNLLQKKNDFYKQLVSINGTEDPLRKTLVIIDEAHLLYSNELKIAEKPNVNVLKQKIRDSYRISGDDSVRLLYMTGTPYTTNPMDLIKFVNIFKDDQNDLLPEDFNEFKERFLDENNNFTIDGEKEFLNSITGYISYLNRGDDIRQFAYPVFNNINVIMSSHGISASVQETEEKIQELEQKLSETDDAKEKNKLIKEINKNKKAIIREVKRDDKNSFDQENFFNNCLDKKKETDSTFELQDLIPIEKKEKKEKKEKNCVDPKEIHPITGKCVEKCKDGKVRNDKGRCVNK